MNNLVEINFTKNCLIKGIIDLIINISTPIFLNTKLNIFTQN